MANKQVNNSLIKEISYVFSRYIGKRLTISRDMLTSSHDFISLETYNNLYNTFLELIKMEKANEDKIYVVLSDANISKKTYKTDRVKKTIIKASKEIDGKNNRDIVSIVENLFKDTLEYYNGEIIVPYLDFLHKMIDRLKEKYSKNVSLSDFEITEIKELIEHYFNKFGLPHTDYFYEVYFIREVLNKIINDTEKSKIVIANKYLNLFSSSLNASINQKLGSKFIFGVDDLAAIYNESGICVFEVNTNQVIVKEYRELNDYIIEGNRLGFDYINIDGNSKYVCGLTIKENNKLFFHSFLNDNLVHQATNDFISLNKYLNDLGLIYFYEEIYTLQELNELIEIINYRKNVSDEEITKLVGISNVIASWITDKLFRYGINEYEVIDDTNNKNDDMYRPVTNEHLSIFKNNLKKQILKRLIVQKKFVMDISYGPDKILSVCLKKAKIAISIFDAFKVYISENEVKVILSDDEPILIYKETKEDKKLTL